MQVDNDKQNLNNEARTSTNRATTMTTTSTSSTSSTANTTTTPSYGSIDDARNQLATYFSTTFIKAYSTGEVNPEISTSIVNILQQYPVLAKEQFPGYGRRSRLNIRGSSSIILCYPLWHLVALRTELCRVKIAYDLFPAAVYYYRSRKTPSETETEAGTEAGQVEEDVDGDGNGNGNDDLRMLQSLASRPSISSTLPLPLFYKACSLTYGGVSDDVLMFLVEKNPDLLIIPKVDAIDKGRKQLPVSVYDLNRFPTSWSTLLRFVTLHPYNNTTSNIVVGKNDDGDDNQDESIYGIQEREREGSTMNYIPFYDIRIILRRMLTSVNIDLDIFYKIINHPSFALIKDISSISSSDIKPTRKEPLDGMAMILPHIRSKAFFFSADLSSIYTINDDNETNNISSGDNTTTTINIFQHFLSTWKTFLEGSRSSKTKNGNDEDEDDDDAENKGKKNQYIEEFKLLLPPRNLNHDDIICLQQSGLFSYFNTLELIHPHPYGRASTILEDILQPLFVHDHCDDDDDFDDDDDDDKDENSYDDNGNDDDARNNNNNGNKKKTKKVRRLQKLVLDHFRLTDSKIFWDLLQSTKLPKVLEITRLCVEDPAAEWTIVSKNDDNHDDDDNNKNKIVNVDNNAVAGNDTKVPSVPSTVYDDDDDGGVSLLLTTNNSGRRKRKRKGRSSNIDNNIIERIKITLERCKSQAWCLELFRRIASLSRQHERQQHPMSSTTSTSKSSSISSSSSSLLKDIEIVITNKMQAGNLVHVDMTNHISETLLLLVSSSIQRLSLGGFAIHFTSLVSTLSRCTKLKELVLYQMKFLDEDDGGDDDDDDNNGDNDDDISADLQEEGNTDNEDGPVRRPPRPQSLPSSSSLPSLSTSFPPLSIEILHISPANGLSEDWWNTIFVDTLKRQMTSLREFRLDYVKYSRGRTRVHSDLTPLLVSILQTDDDDTNNHHLDENDNNDHDRRETRPNLRLESLHINKGSNTTINHEMILQLLRNNTTLREYIVPDNTSRADTERTAYGFAQLLDEYENATLENISIEGHSSIRKASIHKVRMLYWMTLNRLGRKQIYTPNMITLEEYVNILINISEPASFGDINNDVDDEKNNKIQHLLGPFFNVYGENATLALTYGLLRMAPGLWA